MFLLLLEFCLKSILYCDDEFDPIINDLSEATVVTPAMLTLSKCVCPKTSNFAAGIALPRPTLPSSSIVTTCYAPSYNRIKSPDPLCVTATATLVPAVSTSILSTSTN